METFLDTIVKAFPLHSVKFTSKMFIYLVFQSKDPTMPKDLQLGVSFNNVALYRRDETRPLATYNYEE